LGIRHPRKKERNHQITSLVEMSEQGNCFIFGKNPFDIDDLNPIQNIWVLTTRLVQ